MSNYTLDGKVPGWLVTLVVSQMVALGVLYSWVWYATHRIDQLGIVMYNAHDNITRQESTLEAVRVTVVRNTKDLDDFANRLHRILDRQNRLLDAVGAQRDNVVPGSARGLEK